MSFGKKRILPVVVAVALFALSGNLWAGLFFDNGGPNGEPGGLVNNTVVSAEDFTVSAPTVLESMTFWTLEDPGAHDGTVIYTIYGDAGGSPSDTIITSVFNPAYSKALVGNVGNWAEYVYTIDLSAAPELNAGTYWMALNLETFGDANDAMIFWEHTDAGLGDPGHVISLANYGFGWFSLGAEHAFNLTGRVSSPAPLVLMCLGVALFGFSSRLRARQ